MKICRDNVIEKEKHDIGAVDSQRNKCYLLSCGQMANTYLMQAVSRVVWYVNCISLSTFPRAGVAAVDLGACMSNNYPTHCS